VLQRVARAITASRDQPRRKAPHLLQNKPAIQVPLL
jgi:hypothetical protein